MGGRVGAREQGARQQGAFRLGQQLRAAREELGWDLRDASAATAIPAAYLGALEEGQFSALPGPVYTRGYVRTYAAALHLDGDAFTYAYCRLQPQGRFDLTGTAPPSPPRRVPTRFPRPGRVARILGFIVLGFMGLLVINAVWAAVGPDAGDDPAFDPPARPPAAEAPPPPPSVVPTAPAGPLAPTSSDTDGAVYTLGRDTFGVSVEPTGRVWVQVRQTDDGEVVYEGTLTSGENKTFQATGQLWMRVGNQGNVRIVVDGTPLVFSPSTDEPYNIDLRK